MTRRELMQVFGMMAVARNLRGVTADLKLRVLGRTGKRVVPFALGGQASLQWTNPGIDPAGIIVRAVELGVNYLDSANAYGPSQVNYGEAFRRLHLVPGTSRYNAALREKLFVASKTGRRYAIDRTQPTARTAVEELKRSLTQMFGDGQGFIPEGAYLDSIQMHNLTSLQQVDQLYENFDRRDDRSVDRLGALAAMLDFRDGTNVTGLNPEKRRWIRHIGITGHQSSPVLMNALQRDKGNILDTLLVAMNANDRRYLCHQNNVLPLAAAKGMGVIAMKVFADGVFYGKEPRFSRAPVDVCLTVGKDGAVASADLMRYPLAQTGVSCAIVGIGWINPDNPGDDQIVSNLAASQMDAASARELARIEDDVACRHGVETNYFQERARGIVQPSGVTTATEGERVTVRWNGALAGPEPLHSYRVYAGDRLVAAIPYRPQTSPAPLAYTVAAKEVGSAPVRVVASEQPSL